MATVPASFIALAIHFLVHGFFLDVIIIGILPFLSADAGDKSRKALFPWALGGYLGFDLVPNLGPCHRRFVAENAAYAVLRGGAGVYILCGNGGEGVITALVLAVVSHFCEALTIAWELFSYNAPPDSAPPMTLMGLFATWTYVTVVQNEDHYLGGVISDANLNALRVFLGLTWASWLFGVAGVLKNKGKVGAA